MAKKIIHSIFNLLLILLPFFPLTENIFEKVDSSNFSSYLLTCAVIALLIIVLALFVFKSDAFSAIPAAWKKSAWLLTSIGVIVLVPLHMGAPAEGPQLLEAAALEKFRYLLLLLAVIIFAAGITAALKPYWQNMGIAGKAIALPLIAAIVISAWDYYDSFTFSSQLLAWVKEGKNADQFFASFDFHMNWRAAGRILLYVVAAWLSIILAGKSVIRIWTAIVLCIFCLAGIGLCIASVTVSLDYYFPFMVPAFALAPSYWIGIILLNRIFNSAK